LTEDDETATLPNSRALLAGAGITLNDSVAGQLTITATGGSDPSTSYRDFYDFVNIPGTVAADGWDNNVTGSGAAIAGVGIQGRPGVIQLTSGTASGAQSGVIRSENSVAANDTGIVIGGGEITYKIKMRWVGSTGPGNTTATNCFLRCGLVNEISGAPTDGIYITTDGQDSSGAFANEWLAATRNTASGLAYDQDVAIGISSNTWVEAKIVISADGSTATFYIDDVLYATASVNMPAGVALAPSAQIQRAGATGTSFVIQVDYIEVTQVFTTPR
jgi:hypothetical protein